jgi:ATP-binding cassette, subfamily F, member 3
LDLESIDSLTQALIEYPGTLIFVSHDRTFIDNIASRVIELQETGIQDFLGNYSEFVANQKRDYLDAVSKEATNKSIKITANKINYEEQKKRRAQGQKLHRELEKTMLLVEEAEAKIAAIEYNFASGDFFKDADFNQINQMEKERAQLKDNLASLIKDWERLLKEMEEISE